jgi:hypothetical protein
MSALRKKLRDGEPYAIARLVEVDHPDGMGRFWFGNGILEYGGNKYHGSGILGSISSVRSTSDIEIVERTFTVSGVDRDILEGLSTSVKGRAGNLYEALVDDNMRVVEIDLVDESILDVQQLAIGNDGKAKVAITAHGGMFFLLNRSAAKWGPEEAKAINPAESGFDEIHLQEDLQDRWQPS